MATNFKPNSEDQKIYNLKLDRELISNGKTEEGYNIYTSEQLNINLENSGNTDQCPFDCQCCF